MQNAIKDTLKKIVGDARFFDEASILDKYGKGIGFVPDGEPQCVLKPSVLDEIKDIIQVANSNALNVATCSSGFPRINGASTPVGEAMVLDLSEMKRILRINRRNRVAIIEPGVTFTQLKEAAEQEGMRLMMPLLPRTTKSVIASYLEREPATMPRYHWDSPDPLITTEVVYGTGDIMRTGSSAGPGTPKEMQNYGSAQKNPLGPGATNFTSFLTGAQGTMGIVTWASVKLELLPTIKKPYFVQSHEINKLISAMYRMTRCRLADEFFILNNRNVISIIDKNSGQPQPDASIWTMFYCISGLNYAPEKRVTYQEKEIEDILKENGLSKTKEIPHTTSKKFLNILDTPKPGTPWKLGSKGAFQEIFFVTTLDKINAHLSVINHEIAESGYNSDEMGVYIQPIEFGRSCHCEFSFSYDPNNKEKSSMVSNLFLRCVERLMDDGAFFSRPYGPVAEMAYQKCKNTVKALKLVKDTFDPNGILNRGKLCF
jgi:hypothetical protein